MVPRMAPPKPKPKVTKAQNAAALGKRVQTLKNKARELSILCGIDVCFICYDPDGHLQHWPENPDDVRRIAMRYRDQTQESRRKHSLDLNGFLASDASKPNRPHKKPKLESPDSDEMEMLNRLSDDELRDVLSRADSKLSQLQEKLSIKLAESFGVEDCCLAEMDLADPGLNPVVPENTVGVVDGSVCPPQMEMAISGPNPDTQCRESAMSEGDVFAGLGDLNCEGSLVRGSCFRFGDMETLDFGPNPFVTPFEVLGF